MAKKNFHRYLSIINLLQRKSSTFEEIDELTSQQTEKQNELLRELALLRAKSIPQSWERSYEEITLRVLLQEILQFFATRRML